MQLLDSALQGVKPQDYSRTTSGLLRLREGSTRKDKEEYLSRSTREKFVLYDKRAQESCLRKKFFHINNLGCIIINIPGILPENSRR